MDHPQARPFRSIFAASMRGWPSLRACTWIALALSWQLCHQRRLEAVSRERLHYSDQVMQLCCSSARVSSPVIAFEISCNPAQNNNGEQSASRCQQRIIQHYSCSLVSTMTPAASQPQRSASYRALHHPSVHRRYTSSTSLPRSNHNTKYAGTWHICSSSSWANALVLLQS